MQLFDVYPRLNFTPVSGEACYLYNAQQEAYLDLYGGHAVISIGHSHPHFKKRLEQQLQQLAYYSNSLQIPIQQELAQKLGQVSGLEDYQLFLCNSGAEAVENALKLASFQQGRKRVIAFQNSFHGRTSAAVNITDKDAIKAPINKTFPVEFHQFNDLKAIQKSLARRDVCAVVIEGIQGWAGIYPPQADFLQALQVLCQKYETLLVLDEVQSGYGRSGDFFAFQAAGIKPDLVTVAKGMGNGFPLAGVLIHPKLKASRGMLGSTFGGNHLACAAGLAVLEVLEKEKLLDNAMQVGAYWKMQLQQVPGIRAVRGRGLILGLEFDFPVADLRKLLLNDHKILVGTALHPNVLRLLPPLNISINEVDFFLQSLHSSVSKLLVS